MPLGSGEPVVFSLQPFPLSMCQMLFRELLEKPSSLPLPSKQQKFSKCKLCLSVVECSTSMFPKMYNFSCILIDKHEPSRRRQFELTHLTLHFIYIFTYIIKPLTMVTITPQLLLSCCVGCDRTPPFHFMSNHSSFPWEVLLIFRYSL